MSLRICWPVLAARIRLTEVREYTAVVIVRNQRGLHARAAAKVVKLAMTFMADVSFIKDGMVASGRSIMGLMMLGAAPGTEIRIEACGVDAATALGAMVALIERRFDEE